MVRHNNEIAHVVAFAIKVKQTLGHDFGALRSSKETLTRAAIKEF